MQIKEIDPNPDVIWPFIKILNPKMSKKTYEKRLSQILKFGSKFIAAIKDNTPVAIAGIRIDSKFYCGKYLEIDSFVVDESMRGQGIGEEIIKFCINYAKEQKCDAVTLNAYNKNERAHKFYEKMGFDSIGQHKIFKL